MTTITSQPGSTLASGQSHGHIGFLQEVRQFWHQFFVKTFNPYRPELHYMRGPGPAWRARHVPSSHLHST